MVAEQVGYYLLVVVQEGDCLMVAVQGSDFLVVVFQAGYLSDGTLGTVSSHKVKAGLVLSLGAELCLSWE